MADIQRHNWKSAQNSWDLGHTVIETYPPLLFYFSFLVSILSYPITYNMFEYFYKIDFSHGLKRLILTNQVFKKKKIIPHTLKDSVRVKNTIFHTKISFQWHKILKLSFSITLFKH